MGFDSLSPLFHYTIEVARGRQSSFTFASPDMEWKFRKHLSLGYLYIEKATQGKLFVCFMYSRVSAST
jgi:hypothetical protein